MMKNVDDLIEDMMGMGCLFFVIITIPAYITHIAWAIMTLAYQESTVAGQVVLAIVGSVIPPIGVIHGMIIWSQSIF